MRALIVAFAVLWIPSLCVAQGRSSKGARPVGGQSVARLVSPVAGPGCARGLGENVEIEVRELPVSEVVGLMFERVLRVSYVVEPGVNVDRRSVSFRMTGALCDVRAQMEGYLGGLGYRAVLSGGLYKIGAAPEVKERKDVSFVYRVKWRDAGELASELAGLFPEGRFAGSVAGPVLPISSEGGSSSSVGSVAGRPASISSSSSVPTVSGGRSSGSDRLVFFGSAKDVARLKKVLPLVDTEAGELVVRAGVFEVDLARADSSVLSVVQSVFRATKGLGDFPSSFSSASATGSAVAVSAVSTATSGLVGFGVKAASAEFDALLGALSSDQRFRLVTAPVARVRSGQSATLIVGDQVPVLGALSYASAGASGPVQSIEYKNSGVILTARPMARERVIDLDLREEISSFVPTTTGVSASPTLQQRTITSALSVRDGSVIFVGGLSESRESVSGLEWPGFGGGVPGSRGSTGRRTDILLVLQVERVGSGTARVPGLPSVPSPSVQGVGL